MRYLWQHIEDILDVYDGWLPLHHFLKSYFAHHKKLGSRDRRGLSDAVYAWYRVGKSFSHDEHAHQEKYLAALYLCGLHPKAFATQIPSSWSLSYHAPERIQMLQEQGFRIDTTQIFAHDIPFSNGVTADDWRASMLSQPRLFLRIRKAQKEVEQRLASAGLHPEWISDTCIALPNGTAIEGLLPEDYYVVQDASSQATGNYLEAAPGEQWWDCCAGAGGKSLMLLDAAPGLHLTTTDIRPSILQNLQARVRKYHHKVPESFVFDVADETALKRVGDRRFDGIICDVPCTGSGTWARTPEGCYFFKPEILKDYTERQKSILRNAASFLKPDGRLIYITCSVFRAENEEVLEAVISEAGLKLVKSELINGIAIGADSLFAAELLRV